MGTSCISREWTDRERLFVVLEISTKLEFVGKQNYFSGHVEVSAHVLQDIGVRLRMLATASSEELERNRDEILNGNPAKYHQ
jgi:hypothetical protein